MRPRDSRKSTLNTDRLAEDQERLSFYLFVAGGVVGFIRVYFPVEFGFGDEMFNEAKNLAEQGAFANPFYIANTGFTAVNPPLYPLFLALVMKLLATVPSFVGMAAVVGDIVANAFVAAWLPRISFVFFGDAMPGATAAVLWLATAQLMPAWDTNYTLAGLILFCLLSARSIEKTGGAIQFGALAGVGGGFLILLNPSSAMVFLPWIVYLLVSLKVSLIQAVKYSGVLLASLVLVVSPWVLRNYHRLGGLVLRTNLGMTLYASNNECAAPSLAENGRSGCYSAHHPNLNMSEARLLRALGEVEYDRRRTADAKSWVMAHPAHFLRLTAKRFREFWFPPPEQHDYAVYVIWLATVLAIPGLILMIKHREPVTAFMVAVQLIYPLIYYLVVSDVRYRYPVLWLSLLSAGYFVRAISRTRETAGISWAT
jgi:hypothetical protein